MSRRGRNHQERLSPSLWFQPNSSRASTSLLISRYVAISRRIPLSVPTFSGLCAGIVTWCSAPLNGFRTVRLLRCALWANAGRRTNEEDTKQCRSKKLLSPRRLRTPPPPPLVTSHGGLFSRAIPGSPVNFRRQNRLILVQPNGPVIPESEQGGMLSTMSMLPAPEITQFRPRRPGPESTIQETVEKLVHNFIAPTDAGVWTAGGATLNR